MKVQWILSALFVGSTAFAGSNATLMKVTKNSGFVPPHMAYFVKCTVASEMVQVETQTGWKSAVTVYTKAVPDAAAALAFIAQAEQGTIIEVGGPTDGPTSTYIGVLEGPVVDKYVKIYLDYSQVRFKNSAEAAREALVEFGNANCPVP